MELKDQIRIAREAAGLTPQDLAERLGVSRQTIVWWESGEHRPKSRRVNQVEEALNVRLDLSERGNATPFSKTKSSLAVDPEVMRLAVAISRLPRAQREALTTLTFLGEKNALPKKETTSPLPNVGQDLDSDLHIVETPAGSSGEFEFIEKGSVNGSSSSKVGREKNKQDGNRITRKAS